MTEAVVEKPDFKALVAQEIIVASAAAVSDLAFPNPIILGGCGSSGTTLLKMMLACHPQIACGPEISFFDRPRFYRTSIDQLRRMYREQEFSQLEEEQIFALHTPQGGYFGLFYPNYGREYHNCATTNQLLGLARDLRHFVDLYFSNFAAAQGKKRWAEKTPNNVFWIKEIFDFLPEARFVHVIRDGRDVVLSLMESRGFMIEPAMVRWLTSVEAGIRFRGNPRYCEIKYEDLVLDTERTLKTLMAFLGEDYDPVMLSFHQAGKDNPLNYASTPLFNKSIGKWKDAGLTHEGFRAFDLCLSDRLRKIGYEA